MRWLSLLAQAAARLPLERLLIKPPSNKKRLEELGGILGEAQTRPSEAPPEEERAREIPEGSEEGRLQPRQEKVHLSPREGSLSTEETVAYQNREIAKNLLVLERHYAQRLRINGIPCDCGSGRHLLAIESLAEETISMVDNPDVYYRLIDWVKEVAPKSTDEAAKSGQYDNEYPALSRQARDFRKEIIGSLEPSALFSRRVEELPGSRFVPVVTDEERERIREKAHQKIEETLA